MKALRRGGGLTAFHIERFDPESRRVIEAMAEHRFRSIETAASEETSVGWVRPGDPSGGAVDPELLGDGMAWLQLRRDVKRLPGWRLQLELDGIEKTAGRPLTGKQRRQAKQEIRDRLLPTWPVTSNVLDVLVRGDRVLLLSSSKGAVEQFHGLWRDTFGDQPRPLGPTTLAGDGWEQLRPTHFVRRARQEEIHLDAKFLGSEFLTWLWWRQGDSNRRVGIVEALVEDRLQFGARDADAVASSFRGSVAARSPEAKAALQGGALLDRARVSLAVRRDYWQATLDAERLRLGAVKLPPDPEDAETAEDKTFARAGSWFELQRNLEGLFAEFLELRRSPAWEREAQAIGAWVAA